MKTFIQEALFMAKNFGIVAAYKISLYPRLTRDSKKWQARRNNALLKFCRREFRHIIEKYKNVDYSLTLTLTDNSPIWVMWWQGEEQMPPLVQVCYQSLLKNRGTHPVILITKDNYLKYVDLPDFILQKIHQEKSMPGKLQNGISLTHLSDIIRVNLLCKYGGFWIDATIYVTQPVCLKNIIFYSPKQDIEISQVSKCRWAGFCIAGTKELPLFSFIKECCCNYWKKHNSLVDYFLTDYLIMIAYGSIPVVSKVINENSYSCPNLHIYKSIMNQEFNEKVLYDLYKNNPYLKLQWKNTYNEFTSNGKLTYYGFLLKQQK